MSDKSLIEWTDATWNPITGCSVISPGCTNCYAMQLAGTRLRNHPSRVGLTRESAGRNVWNGTLRFNQTWLEQPLAWTRQRMIFVNAHGDLFHEAAERWWIVEIFAVMIAAHHLHGHTHQVLTKRAERMHALLNDPEFWDDVMGAADSYVMDRVDPLNRRSDDARATMRDYHVDSPPPGIWLGVSVEDQRRADERIPLLLQTPAAVRWLSCEPLLGPVDLNSIPRLGRPVNSSAPQIGAFAKWQQSPMRAKLRDGVDWVVVGGESGHSARPMHPDWARSLRDQCAAGGVPYFHKQNGQWIEIEPVAGGDLGGDMRRGDVRIVKADGSDGDGHCRRGDALMRRVKNKHESGRLLDSVEHNGMPRLKGESS